MIALVNSFKMDFDYIVFYTRTLQVDLIIYLTTLFITGKLWKYTLSFSLDALLGCYYQKLYVYDVEHMLYYQQFTTYNFSP